ncbi:MAG: XRE family transcriptional regulator [Bacteroidetes bacterium]|nr:MAG: XRE family transcriptional regulator [Bacteroidota bacterium]KAA3645198.1 MAG: XRE family transcriptional regulator [Bacteroidota bacterium]MBL1144081.1 XRE family transcriptional regulator [Bacteroidota bacterium]NOG56877.1 helix-turn-helix transcriptional regulator [Bacteroidota bacterium]
MTISERIRLSRQQKNISQKDLAELADVNLKSLSRYELGTSIPPADVIKKLADALKVSTDTLLSDDKVDIQDMDLLKKFEVIQNMTGETKQTVIHLIDLAIRDFKAKQAYAS